MDIGPEDVIVGLDWLPTARDTGVRPTAHRCSPKSKRLVIGACRSKVLPDFEPKEDPVEVELSRVGTASSRFLIFSFPRARTRDLCTTCLIWTHRYLLYD
ncbi:hypothetical protein IEO21_09388 [Rhodonia placenta]|uniref:Uncharacterized protein n=1 Tax=Rhodonia placenta TaxID=104341 RepID=A0A8H7NUE2_9APHY|nr:hypothetical protein IEO21_09388 [Postia placenta]